MYIMLVKLPFPTSKSNDGRAKFQGSVYVNPEHVTAVNRTFSNITILFENGRLVQSDTPTTRVLVHNGQLVVPSEAAQGVEFEGMPDIELLDRWYEETIEILNTADLRACAGVKAIA